MTQTASPEIPTEQDRGRPLIRLPLVGPATRGLFSALSSVRGKRIFHPHGIATAGELSLVGDLDGTSPFGDSYPQDAVIRFSRAVGLPSALPDALGISIRFGDAYGPGRHQDFLLVSSGSAPGARHLIVPGLRGFFGHHFSSLLPYSLAGRTVLMGVRPVPWTRSPSNLDELREYAPGLGLELCAASPLGPWHRLATVQIGPVLNDAIAEGLRFNPWNTGGNLRPIGPLMDLRSPAYEGSQAGRADDG